MQISPTAFISQRASAAFNQSFGDSGFDSVLKTLQDNSNDRRAAKDQPKATNSRYSFDNYASLDELTFSKEDFSNVEKSLKKAGVTEETLRTLKQQAEDQSLTWGEMLSVIEQAKEADFSPQPIELAPDTENQISSLLQQLGITPEDSHDVISQMEAGNTSKAWDIIANALKATGSNSELAITKEELAALGQGLQLDQNAIAKLTGILSEAEATLGKAELNQLAAQLNSAVEAQNSSADKLLTELRNILSPQLANAVDANGNKISADMHASNEEKATQILRTDQATEKGLGFVNSVNSKESTSAQPQQNTTNQNPNVATAEAVASTTGSESTGSESFFEGQQENGKNNWMQFFDKITVANAAPTTGQPIGTVLDSFLQQSTPLKQAATSFLDQVQAGVFRSMQNGVNQLSLKLNPADLGPLSVMVSVRSKEVTATVRAENPEAAKAIHENIHTLRASLEAQGLKVDKLDVQTGLQNNLNDKGWNSADQHNAQQEAQQRLLAKQHMRSLKDTKQDLINGAVLQQQNVSHSDGVYLIA